jgi:hypothetical protein
MAANVRGVAGESSEPLSAGDERLWPVSDGERGDVAVTILAVRVATT